MNHHQLQAFFEAIEKLKTHDNEPFVIATMVDTLGSAPQEVGARAIITRKGIAFGTVGGGKIEAKVVQVSQELISDPNSKNGFFKWNLQKDIGMTCGGVVSFFLEVVRTQPLWSVAVFGAGHVSQALVRLLLNLEVQVTCIDSRSEWIEKLPTHPHLTKLHLEEMKAGLARIDPSSFIVIMTMGHSTDLPILIEAYRKHSFPYIGNMGSDVKSKVLRKDLLNAQIPFEEIAKLHCPIGESFGNNSPIEISFSIIAQLLRERDRLWSTFAKDLVRISSMLNPVASTSDS